jgi:hypothetical protein
MSVRPRPGGAACLLGLGGLVGLAATRPARAEPPERVTFQAGRVDADLAGGDVTLERGVDVRAGRYRLRGERMHLRFEGGAVRFDGDAHLALCPCPHPPLTLAASSGRFDPPGDVILRFPRVELDGVPIFALPWLWLRAPDQPGLLPPLVAVRGRDGLLLGSGVHLPWKGAGGALRALDLRAAGFTTGGVELGADLRTAGSHTAAVVDLVHGTRMALDARGALAETGGPAAAAWSLDALRGDRARSGTVALEPAAQPFDVGAAEASLRTGRGPLAVIAAGGVVARGVRGEGPIAAGPRATLALGGPLGRRGSWFADASAVVLGDAVPGAGLPLAGAEAGAEIDARPGPLELRASAGARARYAGTADGVAAGTTRELSATARAELSLPFARTFAAAPGQAALVHWITPVVSLRGALAEQRGAFFAPLDGAVPATSWIAAAGLTTALGRYAGPALRLDLRAGATGDAAALAQPLLHARLGVEARLLALALEAAAVGDRGGDALAPAARGYAILSRARVGDARGPTLRVDAAVQGGAGAGQARAIAGGAWAALPGDALAYLAAPGLTFGSEVTVPWTATVRTAARADLDLTAGTLLAVGGLAAYRHACGCFGLGVSAGHRLGREGVDVMVNVDLAPPARR